MKTLVNFESVYESVNNCMKATKEERNLWKTTFNSLSRLLRVAQSKEGIKIVKPIFERFNLPTTGKVKPSEILALIPSEYMKEDKKGNSFPCYLSKVVKKEKDKEGNLVECKDKEGNLLYVYELRPVRDNAWTLDKFVKVLATATAK